MILCRKTVIFAKILQLFTLNKKEKERTVNEEEIVLTPMMKQFLDLKAQHPDAVMLFRCGDFYETYSTDFPQIVGCDHRSKFPVHDL